MRWATDVGERDGGEAGWRTHKVVSPSLHASGGEEGVAHT